MKITNLSTNPDLQCKVFLDEDGYFLRFKKRKFIIETNDIKEITFEKMKLKLDGTKNIFINCLANLFMSVYGSEYNWVDKEFIEHIKNTINETKANTKKLSMGVQERLKMMINFEATVNYKSKSKTKYVFAQNLNFEFEEGLEANNELEVRF